MKVQTVAWLFVPPFLILAATGLAHAGEISISQDSVASSISIEQAPLQSIPSPPNANTHIPAAAVSSDNRAIILQSGNGNTLLAIQDGSGNNINLVQKGHNNSAELTQQGRDNTIDLQQQGNGNSGTIHEQGNGHSVMVRQTGNGLGYLVTVSGPSQNIRVIQKK